MLKSRNFIGGIVVGAVCAFGIRSLIAEPLEPPAYLVVNTDKYKQDPTFYHSLVSAVVTMSRGKILVEDAKPTAVDDSPDLPEGTISLLAFNSMADLKAFRDSQKYQDLLGAHAQTSKVKHFALEGRPEAMKAASGHDLDGKAKLFGRDTSPR